MTSYIDAGANISTDGKYRYLLWREWRGGSPDNWRWFGATDGNGSPLGEPESCLFIMLNPSTADGTQDDPTIRRCVGFARAWGYDRLEVANLFAYRATNPRELLSLSLDEAVGTDNRERVFEAVSRAKTIICAWGAHGSYLDQDETLLGWIDPRERYCLGITKEGAPRHPLYLPLTSKLLPFRPAVLG